MLRIIPLTIASLVAASALKAVDLFNTGRAQAQSPVLEEPGNRDTSGFGPHSRPWARDLANSGTDEAGEPSAPERLDASVLPLPADFDETDYKEATQALALIRREMASIDRRAAEVENAEALLEAVRLRAQAEVQRLSDVRAQIQALIDSLEQMERADMRRLVEIYSDLKPARAAELLSEQETSLIVTILDRMQEREIAQIIDKMDTDTAREVLLFISERRRVAAEAVNMN